IINLEKLMKIEGYKIEKSRLFRNRLRFDCYFKNEMEKKDVVRAEFNLSFSKTIGNVEKKSAVSEISGIVVANIPVYSLEDLAARKLLALHNRTEGKDIFDLANFIDKANKEKTIIILGMLLKSQKSRKKTKQVVQECIEKLDKLNVREIAALTNNYIPVSLRPEWHLIIENLKMSLGALVK
ncbi:MAG: nucleotidyl transferase AbiEii/AbiGii toxin family protein, partial [Candidatus Aenigmarchaeota archaeon]|nr:nucleotidyl transferase AbiEii/AbiGii toxin family protein [Candidatus Aenigmarchaeota archaeon]